MAGPGSDDPTISPHSLRTAAPPPHAPRGRGGETPTQVTAAWIQGRPVDLTSRHTILNEKYKQRYGQE